MKLKILFIIFFAYYGVLQAQSLSFEDLTNLQKSNLEKAKGFFSYKGFSWYSSDKNKENALNYNDGYLLSYDRIIWKNSYEEVQLLTKAGFENCIFYFTSEEHFNEIENEAKTQFTQSSLGTSENRIWTDYRGHNVEFTFTTKKSKDYYSQKIEYFVCVTNYDDVQKRVSNLCSNCKGNGQIIEYEKCSYCGGDGKQNCDNCYGKGQILCRYCEKGQNRCNKCGGNSTYQCNKCWRQGKLECSKCFGKGTTQCSKCWGKGTVTTFLNGQNYTSTCADCGGKGKFTCSNCSGVGSLTCQSCYGAGKLTCNSCGGTGKLTCQYCKGNYSAICSKCNGSGNTDLVCASCNGKGITNREIKKVCPICNGMKSNPIGPQKTYIDSHYKVVNDVSDAKYYRIVNYVDGKMTGLVKNYFLNGNLQMEGTYMDGKIEDGYGNGLFTWYFENGQKQEEVHYIRGKQDGRYLNWYQNGQKKTECKYVLGKVEGKGFAYNETGDTITKLNYIDGKKEGFGIITYDNGGFYEGYFVNDKVEGQGTYIIKNKDGKDEKMVGEFKNNKLYNGTVTTTHPNFLIYKSQVVNGIRSPEEKQ